MARAYWASRTPKSKEGKKSKSLSIQFQPTLWQELDKILCASLLTALPTPTKNQSNLLLPTARCERHVWARSWVSTQDKWFFRLISFFFSPCRNFQNSQSTLSFFIPHWSDQWGGSFTVSIKSLFFFFSSSHGHNFYSSTNKNPKRESIFLKNLDSCLENFFPLKSFWESRWKRRKPDRKIISWRDEKTD